MRPDITNLESDIISKKQEVEDFLSNNKNPLIDRIKFYQELPQYLSNSESSICNLPQALKNHIDSNFPDKWNINRGSSIDSMFLIPDRTLYYLKKLNEKNIELNNLNNELFSNLFDSENDIDYHSFVDNVEIIEEVLLNNIGEVIIDW